MPDLQKKPRKPIWFIALICEHIVHEKEDEVLSAFRIVDVFYVATRPELPAEKQAIMLQVLVMSRFPIDDDSEHTLEIFLERPDGETQSFGEAFKSKAQLGVGKNIPGHPPGINLKLRAGVTTRTLGLHHVRVDLDGEEISRIPFTLHERLFPEVPKHS